MKAEVTRSTVVSTEISCSQRGPLLIDHWQRESGLAAQAALSKRRLRLRDSDCCHTTNVNILIDVALGTLRKLGSRLNRLTKIQLTDLLQNCRSKAHFKLEYQCRHVILVTNLTAGMPEWTLAHKAEITPRLKLRLRLRHNTMETSKTEEVVCGRYRRATVALGTGGFATVYKCWTDGEVPLELAVKVLATAAKDRKALLAEARLLTTLRHPNIVMLHDVLTNTRADGEGELWLVMEWCHGGSLAALPGIPTPPVFLEITRQTLKGVTFLHEQSPPIQHLDMKPDNVCLLIPLTDRPSDVAVKLVDFGVAEELNASLHSNRAGTLMFYSPERWHAFVEHGKFDLKDDVWATGLSLLQVATGRASKAAVQEERKCTGHSISCFAVDAYRARIDQLLDYCQEVHGTGVAKVLRGLLVRDPTMRLSAREALAMLDEESPAAVRARELDAQVADLQEQLQQAKLTELKLNKQLRQKSADFEALTRSRASGGASGAASGAAGTSQSASVPVRAMGIISSLGLA